MKQFSVLCLSLALMFSLSGCCCGLFGHGGGYGAGYPGGCNSCGTSYYGGYPAASGGACGPGGCGATYPSGSLYGGPAAAINAQGGPVAFAPAPSLGTF